MPRHKLESVQVALRSVEMRVVFGSSWRKSGVSTLWLSTSSRIVAESPAMLPSAHTACSRTSSLGEESSSVILGTMPSFTQAATCSEVPETMLVSAQAASNCRVGACDSASS